MPEDAVRPGETRWYSVERRNVSDRSGSTQTRDRLALTPSDVPEWSRREWSGRDWSGQKGVPEWSGREELLRGVTHVE